MKSYGALSAILICCVTACSSGQSFSDVVGPVRISGEMQHSIFTPQEDTLSLHVTDAATGYPLDAQAVEIQTDNRHSITANRKRLGSYTAHITGADKFDVLVIAQGRTAVISLQRE